MPAESAGILLYRVASGGEIEVWLGHMGGPYWARKQERAWSIPKGELDPGEDPLAAARREFEEEMGAAPPDGDYAPLGEFRYTSGKRISVFAAAAPDFAPTEIHSSTFEIEWPPRSGSRRTFPEIDRAEWVRIDAARDLVVAGQVPLLDAIESLLAS